MDLAEIIEHAWYGCLPAMRMILVAVSLHAAWPVNVDARRCKPTPHDEIGPYYKPDAPLRTKIGEGYVLSGVVRDAVTCKPISQARIEVWMAGPQGAYGDQWRATLVSDRQGNYRIETPRAVPYARRPPHIHILVDIKNYAGLITQHYPKPGARSARFDLIIERE